MSEAFLPTDLASFTRFKSGVQGDNVVEFIDLMVQSLNYRFTSSKINGRRKTEAVSVSIAADKLLRHYIDAKYKNANMDLCRITAIVASRDITFRDNIDLCKYVYNVIQDGGDSNGLPGLPPANAENNRVTVKDYEKLHPGRTLVPLDVADQELADGVFDLSNVFPEQLKKLVSDMRASRATWSGITLLDRLLLELDPYSTIQTLVENRLNDIKYTGSGNMAEFLGNKRKLFTSLPNDSQVRLNNGLRLRQQVQSAFTINGNELTTSETIEFSGFTETILVMLLASPLSRTNVKKVCEELLSQQRDKLDFTKCTNKLVIADKLDQETSPKQLAVNNLKRKKFQPKGACFNCKRKGHRYWECKSPLRPDLQRRVDKFANKKAKGDESDPKEKDE